MEENAKFNIKKDIFNKKSYLNNYNSSYQGLHSEDSQCLSKSFEEIEESISSKEDNDKDNSLSNCSSEIDSLNNDEEIPYTFIWNEGGKNVKVTGSFVNWSIYYDMEYSKEEKLFKYSVKLSKGKHSYKFIVDGIWKCSQNQPKLTDNSNNINNFLDLTNFKPKKKVKKNKKTIKKEKKKKEKQIIRKKIDRGYDIKFPKKDDLNTEAPVIQPDFLETFLIDTRSNQNFIGRSQYLNFQTREAFTEEKSYKELMMAPHISLNHSLKNVDKSNLMEVGINFRFRDKNCTLVYYSHQEN